MSAPVFNPRPALFPTSLADIVIPVRVRSVIVCRIAVKIHVSHYIAVMQQRVASCQPGVTHN